MKGKSLKKSRAKRTSHLLGTAYSTPTALPPVLLAPPPIPEPCSAPLISQDLGGFLIPATTLEGPCKLSRSPWDLLDDLSLSDPQVSIFLSYHIFLLSPTSTPVLVVLCVKFMFSKRATIERSLWFWQLLGFGLFLSLGLVDRFKLEASELYR